MAKKEGKVAEASAAQRKDSRKKPSAPDWGRTGPPPSPTITPFPPREYRSRRRHRAFIDRAGRPSPLLAELMASVEVAPPLVGRNLILEAGALACRRLKNGELSILLISKRRSGKWGIPKGRLNGRLSFNEVAAKEAFEEAGVKGCVSPTSIGMFRMKKRTPSREYTHQVVEVWVYLMEVTKCFRHWPEEGKREIRWVSCETAAKQLGEPILAHLCHRLVEA
jgi:8-oxo-dGTP pyrophosphatase MutT (NUDIX family)